MARTSVEPSVPLDLEQSGLFVDDDGVHDKLRSKSTTLRDPEANAQTRDQARDRRDAEPTHANPATWSAGEQVPYGFALIRPDFLLHKVKRTLHSKLRITITVDVCFKILISCQQLIGFCTTMMWSLLDALTTCRLFYECVYKYGNVFHLFQPKCSSKHFMLSST